MLARCARCQGTFTIEKFGLQTCPHCGSELMLADPSAGATPPAPESPPAPPPAAPSESAPPPDPAGGPAAPPPPTGWGPVPSGPAWQGGAPPPAGWGPVHPPPPPSLGEQASPFAERRTRGFFAAFFETFKLVGTQPADFFRRVRIDQTGAALLFGVLGSTVGNWASLVFGALTRAATLGQLQARVSELPPEAARFLEQFASTIEGLTSPTATAAQMVVAPLLSLISIYLAAGVIHLVLRVLKGAARGFDATLTVVAYASGLYLVMAVPQCGGLIALIWYLAVVIIGLGEAQRCGPGKSAAAVFAPVILLCLCCCGLMAIGGAGAWSAIQSAAGVAKTTPVP
jgi:hypothetical protein